MMSDWVDHAQQQGFPQRPGVTQLQIDRIRPAFARQFGIDIPADYADLLRQCNGFDFDGIVLFGLYDQDDATGFLPGIFDSNERLIHGMTTIDTPLRFVGETGDVLFAFDTDESQWKAVSRYGWHTVFRFSTFNDLFTAVLSTTQ